MTTTTRLDALLLAASVLIAFLLLGPLLTIPARIPLNYNEGWNAYFDLRAIDPRAGPLYPPVGGLVFNNYPPLSFVLVGAFSRAIGADLIVGGRTVALGSLLASSVLLGRCVTRLGGTARGGLVAGVLLLLGMAAFYRDYVATDDPQWLAHALMLAGLAVLLGRFPSGSIPRGRAIGAALLMAAGGFVKHDLAALPLAVTIWLVTVDRRAALAWFATATVAVALMGTVTVLLYPNAAAGILAHHRIVRAGRIGLAFGALAPLLPMLLIAMRAGLAHRRADRPMRLALLFAAIALLTGIPQRLGEGVNYNAQFETLIALCVVTGLAVSRAPFRRRAARPIGPAAVALFAAIPVVAGLPWLAQRPWHDIVDREMRVRAWRPVIARLAASPGLAGCQTLSLCFWAGRPFMVDVFNLDQSVRSGAPIAPFATLAREHAFGLFEFKDHALSGRAATALARDPVFHVLLNAGYAPIATGPGGISLFAPPRDGAAKVEVLPDALLRKQPSQTGAR